MLQPAKGASRRNGKQASCEPCRKAKIRCDHQTPVCGRCKRRGVKAECFYHPAPLTKTPFSLYRNQPAGLDLRGQPVTPSRTSQSVSISTPQLSTTVDAAAGHLRLLAKVITLVQANYELIDRLLRGYYLVSLGSMVPGKILLGFFNSLPDLFESYCIDAGHSTDITGVNALSKGILKNTSAGATLNTALTVNEFIALFSGRNLHLQSLGLICNTAARSVLFGLARDDDTHEGFVRNMLECATSCLESARELAPRVDDAMMWLAHENLLLFIGCEGHTHPSVWRRLGDMTSDLYASGSHREDIIEKDAPFFLTELRRRTFIKAYYSDLSIATYFECPARISRRYANTKMPLDLSDDELLADEEKLQQARARLTSDGWAMDSKTFQSSTWARIRYIMGPWRDEMSKCSYYPRPISASHGEELRNLSLTGRQIWESFPEHLRYTKACWKQPGLGPSICNMLTIMYLSYLYCDFQIHRLLESIDDTNTDALLGIAKDILATVLHLGQARDRAVPLRHDFEFVVLSYGLSSAMVLTSTLASSVRSNGKPLPAGISRSEIIRNLSVFVSHLDTIFPRGNANHAVAAQASSSITRALDEVLEPVAQTRAPPPLETPTYTLTSSTASVDIDELGAMDPFLGPFDEQSFNDWMSSIDWSATSSGWSTL